MKLNFKQQQVLFYLAELAVMENVEPKSFLPKELEDMFLQIWEETENHHTSKLNETQINRRRFDRLTNEKSLVDLIIENKPIGIEITYLIKEYEENENLKSSKELLNKYLLEKYA